MFTGGGSGLQWRSGRSTRDNPRIWRSVEIEARCSRSGSAFRKDDWGGPGDGSAKKGRDSSEVEESSTSKDAIGPRGFLEEDEANAEIPVDLV
ncbi:hypothetical protein Dimus_035679 [Dionaea muscipula]